MTWIEKPHESYSTTQAVIEAVAEKEEVEPTALPPLYEYVEPEILESLFEQTETGTAQKVIIEFVYVRHLVTVTVDDGVTIKLDDHPPD